MTEMMIQTHSCNAKPMSPEHVVVILDVVFIEQHVELLQHQGVVQVEGVPLEALGQGVLLLPHLGHGQVRGDALITGHQLVNVGHWLCRPELITLLSSLLLTLGWTWIT